MTRPPSLLGERFFDALERVILPVLDLDPMLLPAAALKPDAIAVNREVGTFRRRTSLK
jgi:hypothetical protein